MHSFCGTVSLSNLAALKFCFKTCVAMKFMDDDDGDDLSEITVA